MEKPIDEKGAKAIAETIKMLMASEKNRPDEPTPLEQLDRRIRALKEELERQEENPLLKRQILLQLKTALRQREELTKESPPKG